RREAGAPLVAGRQLEDRQAGRRRIHLREQHESRAAQRRGPSKDRQRDRGMTIPYGRQLVDDDDVRAVCDVLRSDWLTTGPAVSRFESAIAEFVSVEHAVA